MMSVRSTSPSTVRCPSPQIKDHIPLFPVPHPEYYLEDGNLVILVENTLFRVFRSTFTRHSAFFKDLFSLPGPVGLPTEGTDDDNPLEFSGISAIEFERLLCVLYPANYGSYKASSWEEWTSILGLATRWDFTDVRTLAIKQLQALEMSPIDKIVVAREYDIDGHWVLNAYTALCERSAPLSVSEASCLGLETAVRIAQLREQLRSSSRKSSRMGGYHALTLSAAMRHGSGSPASGASVSVRAPRSERLQWGIERSYFDSGSIPPPTRKPSLNTGPKKNAAAIPGIARLVAEAFGIDLSY